MVLIQIVWQSDNIIESFFFLFIYLCFFKLILKQNISKQQKVMPITFSILNHAIYLDTILNNHVHVHRKRDVSSYLTQGILDCMSGSRIKKYDKIRN